MAKTDNLLPKSRWSLAQLLEAKELGSPFFHLQRVSSTNDILKSWARRGIPHGTLLLAEEQVGGRGRAGSIWRSPSGQGLWFSVLLKLKPSAGSSLSPLHFTFAASLAVREGIEENTGLVASIKWPNDLYDGGQKLCGILSDGLFDGGAFRAIVVGIGLNANQERSHFERASLKRATSLFLETGRRVERLPLLAAIVNGLEHYYLLLQKEGPKPILRRWRRYSLMLKNPVTVRTPSGIMRGRAVDITDEGALIVESPSGRRHELTAGEVTVAASRGIDGGKDGLN